MPIWIHSGPGGRRVGHAAVAAVGRPQLGEARRSATAGTILTSVFVRPSALVTSSRRPRTAAGCRSGRSAAFRMRRRYDFGCTVSVGIRRAVDERRVDERLPGASTGSGVAGHQRRLPRRVDRVVVGVRDRRVRDVGCRRPEPRAVVPAADRVHAAQVGRVLGRHVDVRDTTGRRSSACGRRRVRRRCPSSRSGRSCAIGRGVDEGLVLDDQRDLVGGDDAVGDELLLGVVGDQVAGGLAGVHVEARDAVGVVVVEHQPRALLVGVEERHASRRRDRACRARSGR